MISVARLIDIFFYKLISLIKVFKVKYHYIVYFSVFIYVAYQAFKMENNTFSKISTLHRMDLEPYNVRLDLLKSAHGHRYSVEGIILHDYNSLH